MAFAEGVNLVLVLVFSLMILLAMILFFVYFSPNIGKGGWLGAFINAVRILITPPL